MLKTHRGLTMIEMVIGIAILSILVAMAVPNFTRWIENMKIRTTAEAVLSGLQLARAEALKGNSSVNFELTSTFGACGLNGAPQHWIVSRGSVCSDAAANVVQTFNGNPTGEKTTIDTSVNNFVFNGLGRLTSPAASTNIDVSGSAGAGGCVSRGGQARCLRIMVNSGGSVRMCDPALPSTDPQAC